MKSHKISRIGAVCALLLALTCASCARQPLSTDVDRALMPAEQQERDYVLEREWWRGYGDDKLNRCVELALAANLDLARSALRIHSALTRAQLAGADLFPTASGDLGASGRRDLTAGEGSHSYQTGLGLRYELDLWGRLRNAADAAAWEHEATLADREAVRLALIHSVINSYFDLRYLKEGQRIQRENIARYQNLLGLVRDKAELGKVAPVELRQAEQSLLSAESRLSGLLTEEAAVRQTLGDLLNCRADELPEISSAPLLAQKNLPIDTGVPVSALAARPDLMAAEARFSGAFYDMQSTYASWYPTLTLAGTLGTESRHENEILKFPFLSGNVGLSLPFLDWARVRGNVRLSEDAYETARLDFVSAITAALNEVWAAYRASEESNNSLQLLLQRFEKEKAITAHYQARYELGAGELKDWLDAQNNEDSTRLSALQAKYQALRDENTVYRAMGGRVLPK